MTDALPAGWAASTIGDVAHYVRGVTYSKAQASNSPDVGLTAVLRANNIKDDLIFNDLVFVPDRFVSMDQVVQDGDVVIAMSSGSKSVVGKAALAKSPPRCGFGAFCGVIRPSPNVEHGLLGYYFRTQSYRNAVADESKGVNINNLKAEHILGRELALPPANEQRRIVSKIDELFSRIDEGEQALKRVEKLVERYRQSVLKAAVTGELTRDWRAARKRAGEPVESGEALLARILKARRAAWEAAELAKLKAKGKPPANDRWKQKYQEPASPDTTDLPELPEGWVWASMDQIGLVSGGLTKNQRRQALTAQRPYLRVANVYANRLDLDEVQHIGIDDGELDRVLLEKGDLLVVEGNGSIDQIGRVAVWDGSIPGCVHQNHLIKVRCTDVLPSWYALIWCLSPLGRDHIRRVASSTAGLHTLSISKVASLPIPVPTFGELNFIQDRFDQATALVVNERQSLRQSRATSAALRQSILKAAFAGQLVPQDPHDEPAAKLLERIAAERAAATDRPRRKSVRDGVNRG